MITRRTALGCLATTLALPKLAFAQSLDRSGTFEGKSRHITTGTATLVVRDGMAEVQLGDDFTFDGAPDPKVALGRDGYDPATLMGKLSSDTGPSSYAVPASIDASQYNEVWIWCERFNVPLGLAKLN
ncbi:MAG: DM13 domain-containing protein [Pseudomonadota bacterium]